MHATILHLVVPAVLAAGCGAPEALGRSPSEPATPPAAPPVTDDEAPTASPIVGQWTSGRSPVDLGDGWTLLDCEGGIPAQCIEHDGSPVGLLELSDWPLTSELVSASDAASATAALRAFADGRHRETEHDRAAGCGPSCLASDELVLFEPDALAELLPVIDRIVTGTPLPTP